MNRRLKNTDSLYIYLEPFLVAGDEQAIAEARKMYTREYKAKWRREKRKREKEITVSWKPDELQELRTEAKRHKTTVTAFIKLSTLAYINKRYLVPDHKLVLKIAQLLALNYNTILELMDDKRLVQIPGDILLKKLETLEREVLVSLHSPKEYINEHHDH